MTETEKRRKAEFRTWFHRKWAEWDAREGRRTTQQELADHLGVTRSAIAQYASGRNIPDPENSEKIALVFGDEIYEVLDREPPLPEFSQFPEPFASRLRSASAEIETKLNSGEIKPNSPEHFELAKTIFARYGLSLDWIEVKEDD